MLETTISVETDEALGQLVTLTGVSKAALVRRALAELLAGMGVVPASRPGEVAPVPTAGRGLATHQKGSK